jgi:hypothetical protein
MQQRRANIEQRANFAVDRPLGDGRVLFLAYFWS